DADMMSLLIGAFCANQGDDAKQPLTASRIIWMRSQRERMPLAPADKLFEAIFTVKSGLMTILAGASCYYFY
ncbi:MAG: hypothetical protein Q7T25_13275, partial [Sideroxyarcus sp.]|nr:hypothetical protein [Sideroxyarcus sp.]